MQFLRDVSLKRGAIRDFWGSRKIIGWFRITCRKIRGLWRTVVADNMGLQLVANVAVRDSDT